MDNQPTLTVDGVRYEASGARITVNGKELRDANTFVEKRAYGPLNTTPVRVVPKGMTRLEWRDYKKKLDKIEKQVRCHRLLQKTET